MPQYFTREEIIPCVVHLKQKRVKKIELEGKEAELWLKKQGEKDPEPLYEYVSGTAFILASDDQKLFLVTAEHVAREMSSSALVILKGEKGNSVQLNIKDLGKFKDPLPWCVHPEADVAVLPLTPSQNVMIKFLSGRFLPKSLLSNEKQAPSRDTPLTVIGFFPELGSSGTFSPLTKQTFAASDLVSFPRADNKKVTTFFVLEDPSIGGYSGGPVFDVSVYKLGQMTTTGEGTRLLGLIHGTLSDKTGGKLAAVVPSFFILETIKLALSKE
ncbi:MAG: trypsin-like peptidase domain-containing protein [Thermodesulfobacteriota bacterium]